MNPDDLARILDELGQRLGPTGEHVFELAVRQVYIDSILGLLQTGIALIVLFSGVGIAARFTIRRYRAECALYAEGKGRWSTIQKTPDLDDYLMPWMLGGMLVAALGAVLVYGLCMALSGLLNPEYAALRDILGAIGK